MTSPHSWVCEVLNINRLQNLRNLMNSNKCPSKVWLSTQILKNFSCAIYTDRSYQEGYGLYLRRCPNSAIIGRYLFVGVVSIIVHIHICDRGLWGKNR